MNDKQSVLTKQQLFVNPISIIQKQINKNQPHSLSNQNLTNHFQINPQKQSQNFNQLLLQTIDSQTQSKPNSKTKQIIKSMTQLSANQLKNKHYRTQMCPDGIQCKKRLVCQFAHNQYQLRRPYKNRKNPCIRYQKGLCSLGAACPDYHGNMDIKKKNYKYKTQKCKQYLQRGQCSKGKLCIYIHDEDYQNNQQESMQDQIQLQNQWANEQKNEQQNNKDKKQNQIQNERQNDQSMIKRPKIGDIFNSKKQGKKIIVIKEVVQQIIQPKQKQLQPNQQNQNQQQQQNFNIQFTF